MKNLLRMTGDAAVRRSAGITIVLILLFLCCPAARSQYLTTQLELSPPNPSSNDVLTFRLSGTWPNGCVPQSPRMSVSGAAIRIETSNPGAVCIQVLTPWVLSASIGELAPGDYSVLLASEELTLVSASPSPCLLVCNRPSTEKLSSSQVSGLRPAQSFRLPATLNRYRQTGLAVINPSATEVISVRVSILDAAGENAKLGVPDSFELKIGPQQRISRFLWQMALEHSALTVILPVPESFQGSVVLSSDRPFAAGALNIMFPEGKFVSIPCLAGSR